LLSPSSQDAPNSGFRSFQLVDDDNKLFVSYDTLNMSIFDFQTNEMTHGTFNSFLTCDDQFFDIQNAVPRPPLMHAAHDIGCMTADARFVFVYATSLESYTSGIWMFEVANRSNLFLWGDMGSLINSYGAGCTVSESGVTANSRLLSGSGSIIVHFTSSLSN
jgi:hypothetical protein